MSDELTRSYASTAHTSVQLQHRIGALQIDVNFALTGPWTVLFGPSGSGKTTILRAIAGLIRPQRGRIVCAGTTLLDAAASIFVPSHLRRTPLASQQPNLFPHLSVERNLLYSPAREGAHKRHPMWERFGLSQVLDSLPKNISGGESQRVNLARAISAQGSRLLLLDEPFTGMDEARRTDLLPWLREQLARDGVPVLSVTHDVAEAFQLGAEVIRIADGRVVAQGPAELALADERRQMLAILGGG